MNAKGVYPILPTPFTPDGQLDHPSLKRLIDYMADIGAHGVAILGFMGEAHKLSTEEKRAVIQTVTTQSANRLQVMVGVRAFGAADAIEQARVAKEYGADAVFVAPIDIQNDDVLYEYYRNVAEHTQLPVMIHDFPESFRTILSANLIARLGNEVSNVVGVKLEEQPVLNKLSQILETAPDMAIFGGLGGEYYLEELQRGARGIMTGFAFPEVLLAIYRCHTKGDHTGAERIFDKYCPLIRYEFQPKIGLAYRKHIYKARGIFESDFIRSPGLTLDKRSRQELEGLIKRVGLSLEKHQNVSV